ncbi:EVE domain-containing protein [Streptomyces stelliscabiei]|uniref:EVE domain-containing protein n=1 Tax=Streptomyces stelliscabiei TaxID=146820 RepID=UPI0029BF0943|nr:EVE domain-containing protein [Streptomyces stelliscabiei]MDX2557945.1 EVE domain-containing protein [Streptomyces stelliscabiei]MDX2613296.1 EVE domain-containing protein [Streptomyces stelliscabiei]MDX2638428.1 EVE domain-containing protein [Streptomyces stelliscabiei]MDX2661580.1 EVE domain-containing protein [Streptomyces stelliscabiei]MDX2712287.1 EVE domain-containing protein [Streptomyces stelliscabiei]
MVARLEVTYGDNGEREHAVENSDALARALVAAVRGERGAEPPAEAKFMELLRDIARASRLIQYVEEWRELAIVQADKLDADASRVNLGVAADMSPSKLYKILEKHGRPKNRTPLTRLDLVESAITAEGGEWDPARVIETLESYGFETDQKGARSLLRDLNRENVLERKPGVGGRAIYRIPGAGREWLYVLDPKLDTVDGGPSTPARVAKLASEDTAPGQWWLGRKLKEMRAGDRLWIYFAAPEKKIAAMAEVSSEPYPAPAGSEKPYMVNATLQAKATEALRKNPVRLEAMANQHPQGCVGLADADLALVLKHAAL